MRSCYIISSAQTFYNESLDEKNINALLELINISSQFLFAWFLQNFFPMNQRHSSQCREGQTQFCRTVSFLSSFITSYKLNLPCLLSSRRGEWVNWNMKTQQNIRQSVWMSYFHQIETISCQKSAYHINLINNCILVCGLKYKIKD